MLISNNELMKSVELAQGLVKRRFLPNFIDSENHMVINHTVKLCAITVIRMIRDIGKINS